MKPDDLAAAAKLWEENRGETIVVLETHRAVLRAAATLANAYLAREADDAKPVDRETERQLKDATMFMRRMARCIDKDHPIRIAAQNWLIREGLQGSPLRNSETNGGE